MADLVFDVDYSDVSRAVDEIIRMGRASKDTGKAFEQGFRLVVQWQEKFRAQQGRINAELEKNVIKQNLANKSARESAAAFQEQERAIQANTAALNQMKMGYDRSYAVEQKTLQLKGLLRQAIANKTMTVREAGAELLKYRQNMIAHNQIQMAATKGANQLGVVTQQAGYQIGDFLVQVQSGTNPLVAFGQQATQLVGILPLLGPSLGMSTTALIGLSTGLGIGIPLITALGAAFLRTKTSTEKTGASVSDVTGALRDYSEYAKTAVSSTADLQKEFGQFADQVRDTAELLAGAAISRAFDNLNTGPLLDIEGSLKSAVDSYEALIRTQEQFNRQVTAPGVKLAITPDVLIELGREAKEAANELGLLPQQAFDFNNMLDKLQSSSSLIEIRDNSQEILDYFSFIYKEGEKIPAPIARALEEIGKMRSAAARVVGSVDDLEKSVSRVHKAYIPLTSEQRSFESAVQSSIKDFLNLQEKTQALKEEIGQAAFEVLRLSGIDLSSNINSAVLAAAKLAADLNISLTDAYKLQNADVSKGVMAAAAAAKELARDLGISLRSAMAMAGMISSRRTEDVFDPRDPRSQGQDFTKERLRQMMESGELYNDFPKDETKGGTGGSGDQRQSRLEQLMSELMTEQEQVQEWRNTQLELLQQFNDQELALIGGQTEARIRIEQEYADRMSKIRSQERSARLSETSGLFSALANLAAVGGKKMVKVQATLSAVATTIAAYESAVKAAAEAVTIPGRIAAYASFLATGLGAVAQIRAAGGIGGGGGAGAASSISGAAATVPATSEGTGRPTRVIIEGIDRNSLITGEQLANIFDQLYKENEDRGFVFEVAQ